ncbi:MAG: type III-B CRISPR module-associated Cmr3 family protein [Bryobacteraceae bacterium]
MNTSFLEVTARDPIVARDGRPFGAGQNRMRALAWPPPSLVAGSLRTALAKSANREFSDENRRDLLDTEITGVLPVADEELHLPEPRDCVVHPDGRVLRTTPQPLKLGGWNLPAPLMPVQLTQAQAAEDFKPVNAPAWWPLAKYSEWLLGEDIVFDHRFLRAPEVEQRMHVQLDPVSGAAEDRKLFSTAALPLAFLRRYGSTTPPKFAQINMTVRVRGNHWCGKAAATLNMLHPLGGERRLVHWKAISAAHVWACPPTLREALGKTKRIRMVLATPAIFRGGWKPGWLDGRLTGEPPGTDLTLTLVGVSIQRWQAISGWSLAEPKGPKAIKRVVPAGGVYFFESARQSASALCDRWLESVSDNEQDQRDGFGLAAWGIW